MLRLIQPKDRGCATSGRSVTEGNGSLARNCNSDEGKTRQAKTDEANNVPVQSGVTKPGPVNVLKSPAGERTSLHVNPAMGKLTYNPITHAPSMIFSLPLWFSVQNFRHSLKQLWLLISYLIILLVFIQIVMFGVQLAPLISTTPPQPTDELIRPVMGMQH